MSKQPKEEESCPNCGYCKHCGRGGGYWTQPYYPYPWWGIYPPNEWHIPTIWGTDTTTNKPDITWTTTTGGTA